MKKDLLNFQFDMNSLLSGFDLCNIKHDFDKQTSKFKILQNEVGWDDSSIFTELLDIDFDSNHDFISVKKNIVLIESLLKDVQQAQNKDLTLSLIREALNVNLEIQDFYSSSNSEPLYVYPLFARWFVACALINVYALVEGVNSCLQSIEFWKSAKEYLDKCVIFMVSKLKIDKGYSEESLPKKLNELSVYKNYSLLTMVEGGLEVGDNSLVKKEDLLDANDFINAYTVKIINKKL